jgi:hypothetical protein
MLSQPKKRTLQILLAMLVASLGVVFIRNLIDFPVYYRAGQSLLNGRTDLYAADFALGQVMDYRYPPFFLLIFAPLWLLPYKFAAYLWYLLGVLQIYGCLLILKNLLQLCPIFHHYFALWQRSSSSHFSALCRALFRLEKSRLKGGHLHGFSDNHKTYARISLALFFAEKALEIFSSCRRLLIAIESCAGSFFRLSKKHRVAEDLDSTCSLESGISRVQWTNQSIFQRAIVAKFHDRRLSTTR